MSSVPSRDGSAPGDRPGLQMEVQVMPQEDGTERGGRGSEDRPSLGMGGPGIVDTVPVARFSGQERACSLRLATRHPRAICLILDVTSFWPNRWAGDRAFGAEPTPDSRLGDSLTLGTLGPVSVG